MIKNVFATAFGLLMAVLVLFCAEAFFRFNQKAKWLAPFSIYSFKKSPRAKMILEGELAHALEKDRTDKWQHPMAGLDIFEPRTEKITPGFGRYGETGSLTILHVMNRESDGRQVFDVKYTIEKGRRKITRSGPTKGNKRYIFAGCSYTLGQGVNDEDTYPQRFSDLNRSVEAFNLGWAGFGINDFVHRLITDSPVIHDLKGGGGTLVYAYLHDHIGRTLCGMDCLIPRQRWKALRPYLEVEPDLRVVDKGVFEHHFPWNQTWLIKLFETALVQYVGDGGVIWSDRQLHAFVRIISAARKLSEEILGTKRFIVLVWPGDEYGYTDRVIQLMNEEQLEVANFGAYDNHPSLKNRFTIPIDGHPTPPTHFSVAWLLDQYLQKWPNARDVSER